MAFELVIFDCDGTLMDSLDGIWRGVNGAMIALGCNRQFSHADVAGIVGLSLREAFAQLLPEAGENGWRGMEVAYKEQYRRLVQRGDAEAPLYPGVRATLTQLHEQGLVLGIATGKSTMGLKRSLQLHDLEKFFSFFQTADTAPSKPHPAMVTQMLRESGLSAVHTLMVGDTDFDMLMGREAGVATCAVTFGCHTRERLARTLPDFWLEHMADLPELLGVGLS